MLLINAWDIFYNHLSYWLHSLKAKELLTSKYLLLCYNRHELFWFFKKDWLWEGVTEDGMVGWHHWLNGHEFEQTPGDSGGKESLASFSPWGLQRIRHNLATEQQFWFFFKIFFYVYHILKSLWICYNIASVLCFGFLAQRHVGPLTRDGTHAPLIGRWSLNHWAAREVPEPFWFLMLIPLSILAIKYPVKLRYSLSQLCKYIPSLIV